MKEYYKKGATFVFLTERMNLDTSADAFGSLIIDRGECTVGSLLLYVRVNVYQKSSSSGKLPQNIVLFRFQFPERDLRLYIMHVFG